MKGLNEILKLGPALEAVWSGPEAFPRLAFEALSRLEYGIDTDGLDREVAAWLLETKELPYQINLHDTFGQPPVTVFNNGKFVVDLYFWVGADTSLHSHGFRGAFRVLHGSSLEEVYEMRVRKQISHDVELTEPQLATMGFLHAGDVRTIGPGRELSHRVIHLDNPTITLCVKTIGEEALPQWHYFGGGLAIQRRHVPEALVKKVYFYQYLAGGPGAEAYLAKLIDGLDVSMRLNLAEEIAGQAYDLHEDTAAEVLEAVYKRHQDELWFRLYEDASRKQREEEDLFAAESPSERLCMHFKNTGMLDDPRAKKMLEQLG